MALNEITVTFKVLERDAEGKPTRVQFESNHPDFAAFGGDYLRDQTSPKKWRDGILVLNLSPLRQSVPPRRE